MRGVGRTVLAVGPLAALALLVGWPIGALVWRAVRPPSSPGAFADALRASDGWGLTAFTLAQAAASTLVAVLFALPIAWLLARVDLPGRAVLRVLVTVPFVLPTVVVAIAFRVLLAGPLAPLGLDGGVGAIIVAHAYVNLAIVARVVAAAWATLDPRPEQAARTLGAGRLRAAFTVTLPALAPAIASAAGVVFLFCATSFGLVLILGGGRIHTLETAVYRHGVDLFDIPTAVALSLLQLVVVAAAAGASTVLARRASGPGRTTSAPLTAPRGWAGVAASVVLAEIVVVVLVPPAMLVWRSVQPRSDGPLTLAGYRLLASSRAAGDALWYSLSGATAAAVLALALGLLAATALSRARGVAATIAGALSLLPLGVSAVTLGFGYLLVMTTLPREISTSPAVVPCVQAVVATPLVIRILAPAFAAIDDRQRQAAATLGAGPLRVWLTVDLAMNSRSVAAAAGFAYVIALGEFGAATFLARPDTTTLPVFIGAAIGRPGADDMALALAASVLLMVVTAVVVGVVEALRRGQEGGL